MPGDSLTVLILLFVAAACGWAFARFTGKRRPPAATTSLSPGYLRGVNFLLEDKPDKAIEVFVSMMEVDNETVDTHFALGSLFRRRGEVDRAIRIHQNLIARPNLAKAHREQALFALAEDYLGAGLLDRAEGILVKLADQSARRDDALSKLTALYELQHDWAQAIQTRRRMGSSPQNEQIVAHYFCELANEALQNNDPVGARGHLKSAQGGGVWLLRGAMMRASMALNDNDQKTALRLLKRVAQEDPALLLEVWTPLRDAFAAGRAADGFDRFLTSLASGSDACSRELTQIALIHADTELTTARTGMSTWLAEDAILRQSLQQLGVIEGSDAPDDSALARIMAGLGVVLRARANFLCSECGYVGEQLYWQCPGCRGWDVIRPRLSPNVVSLPKFAS